MAGPTYQNAILFDVNLVNAVAIQRQNTSNILLGQYNQLAQQTQQQLDQYFQLTVRRIVIGYAIYRNALELSGLRTFKPAMRRFPEFQCLDEDRKEEIYMEMEYTKHIYEGWEDIVRNCTLPYMTNIDIGNYPLWKLARCTNLTFVESESNKNNRQRPRPTSCSYHLFMVDDIINNVEGSTDRILDVVRQDADQINLISKDFQRVLLRRANHLH